MGAKRLRQRRMMLVIASSITPFLILELFCRIAFSDPRRLPSGMPLLALRGVYMNTRSFVQYNRHCSRYDPTLTYTLRPGKCTFSNVEFSSEIRVNSRGLRDDEASLKAPDIIVLGDSHSMGWGVNQDETYSSLLEKSTGMSVLNTAITSYGTAREVEAVQRLSHQHAKIIIIQYCPNDFGENRSYVNNQYKLIPMPESTYDETVRDIEPPAHYLPGWYLARTVEVQVFRRAARLFLGSSRLPDPTGPSPRPESYGYAADLFVKIIRHSGLTLGRRLTIVLEIDAFKTRGGFLSAVKKRIAREKIGNILTMDLHNDLRSDHYYKLDDHINKLGHRLIAMRAYKAICESGDASLRSLCTEAKPRLNAPSAEKGEVGRFRQTSPPPGLIRSSPPR